MFFILFIHTCSSEFHGFCPECHPDLSTPTSVRKEKPLACGLVYKIMVVEKGTRDVFIFSLDILQVLFLTSSGDFFFFSCLFRLNRIVLVWVSRCSFAPPQTGTSFALKYKSSY